MAMMWHPSQPEPVPAHDGRPPADHAYVFTIAGRCGTCQRTEVEHPTMLPAPDPMTACSVDHGVPHHKAPRPSRGPAVVALSSVQRAGGTQEPVRRRA
jgi:hypothetical protein